jgi:hypothetical protein
MELHIIDISNICFSCEEISKIKKNENKIHTNPYELEKLGTDYRVIVADQKYVYVTKQNFLDIRLSTPPEQKCKNFFMVTSILHENILKDGTKLYCFGNLFGADSILLDNDDIVKANPEILCKRLKNVRLRRETNGLKLTEFEYR